MPNVSDHELVQKARAGDTAAFGEFVRRHQKRIFRLTFHMLRDPSDAEDITQEAFVRAYRALDRFEGGSQPFTWLYRIAVNLCLNSLRTRKTRQRSAGTDDPRVQVWMAQSGMSTDASDISHRRELAAAVVEGMDGLSETLRTTLILVCVDGMDQQAAAQVLGCPVGTVAWRVHEARRKLREFLEHRGWDLEGQTVR